MSLPPPELIAYATGLGLELPEAGWRALQGGQTNQLWQVDTAKGAKVIKLFRPNSDTPLFPNDPSCEARMLAALAPSGLAPVLSHQGSCALGTVLIYDHQPGELWSQDPARAAKLLKRLHAHPIPDGLRHMPGGSDMVEGQVATMWASLTPALQSELTRLKPQTPVAASRKTALLHGDPVPGNLLIGATAAQDMLIDWQCPALGDVTEDLALFLSPAMQQIYRGQPLNTAEHARFLDAYGEGEITDRLAVMAPWHHWRMVAYCGWKATQGSAAYAAALPLEMEALIRSRAPAGS